MAIARTALETLANGETDPEVRKLARETLDGFNVLSEPEQFMNFMMGVQQSQPISEVDPTESRRFHERMAEHARQLKPGSAIGLRVFGARHVCDRSRSFVAPQCVSQFTAQPWCPGRMAARHRSR